MRKKRLLKGNLEIERQLQIDKYAFENITTGYEFEEYLRSLFEGMGYIVNLTQKSNDQGGDLVIEKDRERTVVQAKFYSSPVGNKAVQEVVAAKSFYEANKGMIVTNSTYTNSAVALAEVNDITLIDGDELNRIRNAILETI
jgi:HJR/Mrr/RecB family endonuclease